MKRILSITSVVFFALLLNIACTGTSVTFIGNNDTDGDEETIADGDNELNESDSESTDSETDYVVDGDVESESDNNETTPDKCADVSCPVDDNPCTISVCNAEDGQCYDEFNTEGVCQQDENPCTVNACDPEQMKCITTNNDTANCDDGNPCNGEESCEQGVCVSGDINYCCTDENCPAGQACFDADNEKSYCKASIDFDTDPNGQSLGNKVDVSSLYAPYGVLFSTAQSDLIVATDSSWELDGDSKGNGCSTLSSYGQRWRGSIIINFIKPPEAYESGFVPALVKSARFYSGDTQVERGLRVRAYDINGLDMTNTDNNKIYDGWINQTGWVDVAPSEAMHTLVISPNIDPDFIIDDLSFSTLIVP